MNLTFFAVRQFDLDLRVARTRRIATLQARVFDSWTSARFIAAYGAWFMGRLGAGAWGVAALCAGFWLGRFAIPLRVIEMVVRPHQVVNREVVLAVIQARATPDDLLELDHRIDRSHQHNVAHIACVHAGGEFLGRGDRHNTMRCAEG